MRVHCADRPQVCQAHMQATPQQLAWPAMVMHVEAQGDQGNLGNKYCNMYYEMMYTQCHARTAHAQQPPRNAYRHPGVACRRAASMQQASWHTRPTRASVSHPATSSGPSVSYTHHAWVGAAPHTGKASKPAAARLGRLACPSPRSYTYTRWGAQARQCDGCVAVRSRQPAPLAAIYSMLLWRRPTYCQAWWCHHSPFIGKPCRALPLPLPVEWARAAKCATQVEDADHCAQAGRPPQQARARRASGASTTSLPASLYSAPPRCTSRPSPCLLAWAHTAG